jgi:hypothetical protein
VGLNSLKSLNLTNVYPNNNKKNKNKSNKVKSKPLLAGKKLVASVAKYPPKIPQNPQFNDGSDDNKCNDSLFFYCRKICPLERNREEAKTVGSHHL